MKLLFTLTIILFSHSVFSQSPDNCVVGAFAVVGRALMSCQSDPDKAARFVPMVNNSRLAMFLEDNRNNEKIKDLFYKARGISVEDTIKMLNGAVIGYNYTSDIIIPENEPERLQALKDFVAEYNAIQNYRGMVPLDPATTGVNLPSQPTGSKTTAD